MTVEQFLQLWLRDVVTPSKRASTAASYEQIVRIHIVPAVGKVRLQQLSTAHVQQLLAKVTEKGRSPRTVQYVRAVLRAALNQAIKWDLIERNAAARATPPRSERYEAQVLDVEGARQFLRVIEGERLRALFVVGLSLGLRHGEALALRWQDVDLDTDTLHVRQTVQRVNGVLVFGEPKSATSRRSLNMPEVLTAELRAHQIRQSEERLLAGRRWVDHNLVFPTSIGTPIDMRNSLRALHQVLEQHGLPRMRFHDLRHTAATLLLAQGVQPRMIMETLGHSQYALTMNLYSHVMPAMKQETANRMNEILGGENRPENQAP
jgi:integrase